MDAGDGSRFADWGLSEEEPPTIITLPPREPVSCSRRPLRPGSNSIFASRLLEAKKWRQKSRADRGAKEIQLSDRRRE
jgi:hypothetical protein